MDNNPPRIKPLLTHQVTIKSLYTYGDFLRKRPRKTLTFRFSAKEADFESSKKNCKRIQAKLFKALELARPIRKVDLSKFMLEQDDFRKSKLLSVFKNISKVKAVYMYRKLRGYEKRFVLKDI